MYKTLPTMPYACYKMTYWGGPKNHLIRGRGLVTHKMFVPRNYDVGILTFGLGGVAFDAGSLTRGHLTQGDF